MLNLFREQLLDIVAVVNFICFVGSSILVTDIHFSSRLYPSLTWREYYQVQIEPTPV